MLLLLVLIGCTKTYRFEVQLDDPSYGVVLINGESILAYDAQEGAEFILSVTPSETTTFHGWYEGDQLLSQANPFTYVMPKSDVILKAVFNVPELKYNVIWRDWDNTVLEEDNLVLKGTIPSYDAQEPHRQGYVFDGWSPTPVPVTADATYTATYLPSNGTYSVSFELANGETKAPITNIALDTLLPEPTSPVKIGYTFEGWSSTNYVDGIVSWPLLINQNYNLLAIWSNDIYLLTYHLDGATNAPTNPTTYQYTSPEITLSSPSKDGFNFIGWFLDPELTQPIYLIPTGSTGNLDLYPRFTVHPVISLTFETNGGTGIAPLVVNSTTLVSLSQVPETTYYGYLFDGWYLDSEFNEPVIWPFTLSQNVTIYASWYVSSLTEYNYSFQFTQALAAGNQTLVDQTSGIELTWVINAPSASGFQHDAWQIGSTDAPQHGDWTIYTILPEHTILLGYDLVLSDDGNGAEYYVEFGAYHSGWVSFDSFNGESFMTKGEQGLNHQGQKLTISMWTPAPLPFYFKSIHLQYRTYNSPTDYLTGTTWDELILAIEDITGLTDLNDVFPSASITAFQVLIPSLTTIIVEVHVDWSFSEMNTYFQSLIPFLTFDENRYRLDEHWLIAWDNSPDQSESWFVLEFDAIDPLVYQQISSIIPLYEYPFPAGNPIWGMPSIGSFHIPLILIQFPDDLFTEQELINVDIAFNGTAEQTGWESVSSFYLKSSGGLLDLTYDIYPVLTTPYEATHYLGETADLQIFNDVFDELDQIVDFSQYDFNQDQAIDAVVFIYSYPYNSKQDPWWAWVDKHPGDGQNLLTFDGLILYLYMWASYDFATAPIDGHEPIALNSNTFIHETGHLLTLPDYYSTYRYLGYFDMMDRNCGDHGPLNKILFGWIEPYLVTPGTKNVTIGGYEQTGDTLLIPYPGAEFDPESGFSEYLLIIYYTPTDLYAAYTNSGYIPKQTGVIIYHIDARISPTSTSWDFFKQNNNNAPGNQLIRILEADKDGSFAKHGMSSSDMLQHGSLDLSTYIWNQGGEMNVILTITRISSTEITITITSSVE
jgi:M6 family metalloprotease-like protein/uncharacterized repeat protein (TIGR02543 family)